MRLLALALLSISSHSLRVAAALALGLLASRALPTLAASPPGRLLRWLLGLLRLQPGRRVNGMPSGWRPPTRSGRYLSQEEYEREGEITTDASLQKLFASPQYQRWLLENHSRMRVPDEPGRAPGLRDLCEPDGDERD